MLICATIGRALVAMSVTPQVEVSVKIVWMRVLSTPSTLLRIGIRFSQLNRRNRDSRLTRIPDAHYRPVFHVPHLKPVFLDLEEMETTLLTSRSNETLRNISTTDCRLVRSGRLEMRRGSEEEAEVEVRRSFQGQLS